MSKSRRSRKPYQYILERSFSPGSTLVVTSSIGQGRIWEIHFDEVSSQASSGQERIGRLDWGSTRDFCSILLLEFRR